MLRVEGPRGNSCDDLMHSIGAATGAGGLPPPRGAGVFRRPAYRRPGLVRAARETGRQEAFDGDRYGKVV